MESLPEYDINDTSLCGHKSVQEELKLYGFYPQIWICFDDVQTLLGPMEK